MAPQAKWIKEWYELLPKEHLLAYAINENGNISCHANGQSAFLDSYASCALYKLPFYLETIGFGYICFPLIFAIFLISIFGKIKENYRWFILNQAIWDSLVIYNFICSKPSWNAWFQRYYTIAEPQTYYPWLNSVNQGPATCFYSVKDYSLDETYLSRTLKSLFIHAINYAMYSPLFLLTFSRFLSLFFKYFQEQLKSTIKVVGFIVSFSFLFVIAVNLEEWYQTIINIIFRGQHEKCMDLACNDDDDDGKILCNSTLQQRCNVIFVMETSQKFISVFKFIQLFLPALLLILSNIFGFSIFFKIIQQLKMRVETNSQNLMTSLRIAIVILFQCLTTTFLFIISAFEDYLYYYQNRNYDIVDRSVDMENILKNWPSWFRFLTLPETIQCFSVIRIFLDSIIILVVLSCYRKIWIAFIKFIIKILKNPKAAFKKHKTKNASKIITISSGPKSPRPLSRTISIRSIVVT